MSHRAARTTSPRAVAVLLAGCLLLAGCAGGGDDAADPGPRGFSYATSDPVTLHPGRQTIAFDQVRTIFSSLTYADKDGRVSYLNAASVQSRDAVHWTVRLRPGWTFHNGEKVTASSYVRAWNTTAYGPNAWENGGQLSNIAGYDALNPAEGTPSVRELSGLRVVDELTFTVTLKSPDGQFPIQLSQAQSGFYPLPEVAYRDAGEFAHAPVGNGPYRIEGRYEENEPISVVRYDGYRGPRPDVERIVFKPYSDMITAYTDVLANNTDVLFVPAARMAQVRRDFGDRTYVFDGLGMSYLGLPLWDRRYADVRVRQAISMAIDRQAVSTVIYGGLWTPATALTPPGAPGTPVGLCGEPCTFNPERARQLLAEAGGWSGSMEIRYPGGSGLDDLYSAYANQLRQNLGIAEVTAAPTTDFPEFQKLRNDRDLSGPYFSRWGALYASQQNTLRSFYTEAGGCRNCIPYYTPEVSALLARADAQLDQRRAIAGYVEVQRAILKDFPAPPMFFEKYTYATSDRVTGLTEGAGALDLTRTRLAAG